MCGNYETKILHLTCVLQSGVLLSLSKTLGETGRVSGFGSNIVAGPNKNLPTAKNFHSTLSEGIFRKMRNETALNSGLVTLGSNRLSLSQQRCVLTRLRQMRQKKRDEERAGDFLSFARLRLKRADLVKCKARWFQCLSAMSQIAETLLAQSQKSVAPEPKSLGIGTYIDDMVCVNS